MHLEPWIRAYSCKQYLIELQSNIKKATVKLQSSVTNKVIYYLSSIQLHSHFISRPAALQIFLRATRYNSERSSQHLYGHQQTFTCALQNNFFEKFKVSRKTLILESYLSNTVDLFLVTLFKWNFTRAIFQVMSRRILVQPFNKTPLNVFLLRYFSQLFLLYYPCGCFIGRLVISSVSPCCFTSFVPLSFKNSLSNKSFQLTFKLVRKYVGTLFGKQPWQSSILIKSQDKGQ